MNWAINPEGAQPRWKIFFYHWDLFVSVILNPQNFINYSKSSDESNFGNFDVFILFHTFEFMIGGFREGFY